MMTCALCGYEFKKSGLVCHSSCPLATHCAVICCPNCGYQVVDESRAKSVYLLRQAQALWKQWRVEETTT